MTKSLFVKSGQICKFLLDCPGFLKFFSILPWTLMYFCNLYQLTPSNRDNPAQNLDLGHTTDRDKRRRKRKLKTFNKMIFDKIKRIQNPSDCRSARKLICDPIVLYRLWGHCLSLDNMFDHIPGSQQNSSLR